MFLWKRKQYIPGIKTIAIVFLLSWCVFFNEAYASDLSLEDGKKYIEEKKRAFSILREELKGLMSDRRSESDILEKKSEMYTLIIETLEQSSTTCQHYAPIHNIRG